MEDVTTAEVCDSNRELILNGELRALQPIFRVYGRRRLFSGPIVTVKVFEDNVLIRELIEEKGNGRVLVVDGGGSLRCAILGGNPVVQAENNGWAGIVVNGCVRDVDEINSCKIGVRALASTPVKASKMGIGQKHVPVVFAGTRFKEGEWLYADTDVFEEGSVCKLTTMALVTNAEVVDWNRELIASGDLRTLQPIFQTYGRREVFSGKVVTLKVFEDNVLIRKILEEEKGSGRVLVVDGGGSLRCAILGGNSVIQAENNGWTGIVVNGCIRDVDTINRCHIGVRALASHPIRGNEMGFGEKYVQIAIAGTRISNGEYLFADNDGILVSKKEPSVL